MIVGQGYPVYATCGDEVQGSRDPDEPWQTLASCCRWQKTQSHLWKPQSGLEGHKGIKSDNWKVLNTAGHLSLNCRYIV